MLGKNGSRSCRGAGALEYWLKVVPDQSWPEFLALNMVKGNRRAGDSTSEEAIGPYQSLPLQAKIP